ncbi:MAG: hypothetical protein AAB550_01965 [Patescibacteria group bacterium]
MKRNSKDGLSTTYLPETSADYNLIRNTTVDVFVKARVFLLSLNSFQLVIGNDSIEATDTFMKNSGLTVNPE